MLLQVTICVMYHERGSVNSARYTYRGARGISCYFAVDLEGLTLAQR